MKRSSGAYGLTRSHFEFDLTFIKPSPNGNSNISISANPLNASPSSSRSLAESWVVAKRYSDFIKLYKDLRKFYPHLAIPDLPPKVLWLVRCNVDGLLDERRRGLQTVIDACIAAEELRESNILLDFIKSPDRNVLIVQPTSPEKVKILDEICKLETELDEEMQRELKADVRLFGLVSSEIDVAIRMMILAIACALFCLAASAKSLLSVSPTVVGDDVLGNSSMVGLSRANDSLGLRSLLNATQVDADPEEVPYEFYLAGFGDEAIGKEDLRCMMESVKATGFELGRGTVELGVDVNGVADVVEENRTGNGQESSVENKSQGWDAPLILTVLGCAAWYLLEYHTIPKRIKSSPHIPHPFAQIAVTTEVEGKSESPVEETGPVESTNALPTPEEEPRLLEDDDSNLSSDADLTLEAKSETDPRDEPVVIGSEEVVANEEQSLDVVATDTDRGNAPLLRKQKVTARAITLLILSLLAIRSREVFRMLAAFGKLKAKV